MVNGRKNTNLLHIKTSTHGKNIWLFHCASLGEYEMAFPIAVQLTEKHPNIHVVFSFYSPSGYNHAQLPQGNFSKTYLPWDTSKAIREFLATLSPEAVIIMRYEFWLNFLSEINLRNIPLYFLGTSFREDQFIWKPWGKAWKQQISKAKYIGVIDESMLKIGTNHGLGNIDIFGDPKFSRALLRAKQFIDFKQSIPTNSPLHALLQWANNKPTLALGSSWPTEENMVQEALNTQLLNSHFNSNNNWQIIVAPHDISATHCNEILKLFDSYSPVLFSDVKKTMENTHDAQHKPISANCKCIVLDSIGQLALAYSASKIAVIGGGFGKGLHNITEALAFGVPVLFGPKFGKFPEAQNAINANVAIPFHSAEILAAALHPWMSNPSLLNSVSQKAALFTESNKAKVEEFVKMTEIQSSN